MLCRNSKCPSIGKCARYITPLQEGDTVVYGFVPKSNDKCHLFLDSSVAHPLRLNQPNKEPQQMAFQNPNQEQLYAFTSVLSEIVQAAPFDRGTKLLGLVTLASATIVSDIKPEKWGVVVELLKEQLDRVLTEGHGIRATAEASFENDAPVN